MADLPTKRRLAAIVVADVVGFSRMMEEDEAATLAALKERRSTTLQPIVREHGGRIVKVMGDGVLLEFPSAVNAMSGAVELQRKMRASNAALPEARRIILRIGINLGDVVIDGGDIYGDGVNIASRIQGLAEPGDIYISASIYDQVKRKLAFGFADLGMKSLKNIAEEVHVYRVLFEPSPEKTLSGAPEPKLPARPSVAVLPFTNQGGESRYDVFADGLTEDLVADLARNPGLFVIARHSSFAYKDRSVDFRQAAHELGVRYLVEGSARRAAGRVRIKVQLIDAVGGDTLWSERFDRDVGDIFDVQDEVTDRISEALLGRVADTLSRSRPKSLEAYDLCVRGRSLVSSFNSSPEALREAEILLNQAVSIDTEYAEACRLLAFVHWQLWAQGIDPNSGHISRALELARKAVALDANDAANHWLIGYLLAYEKRWAESDKAFADAFALEPDNADALAIGSEVVAFTGRTSEAVEMIQRALILNPKPPGWYYWQLGFAYFAAGQYQEAVKTLRMEAIYRSPSRRLLAASLAHLGRLEEAEREATLFMAMTPKFTITHWLEAQPVRDMEIVQRFVEGYRLAGLPE